MFRKFSQQRQRFLHQLFYAFQDMYLKFYIYFVLVPHHLSIFTFRIDYLHQLQSNAVPVRLGFANVRSPSKDFISPFLYLWLFFSLPFSTYLKKTVWVFFSGEKQQQEQNCRTLAQQQCRESEEILLPSICKHYIDGNCVCDGNILSVFFRPSTPTFFWAFCCSVVSDAGYGEVMMKYPFSIVSSIHSSDFHHSHFHSSIVVFIIILGSR